MNKSSGLTSYRAGSFKELAAIMLPLTLIALSENVMIFLDRIILSHYSLAALNATTLASQAIEIFQYGLWAITGMSELFVARLYAQKAHQEIAKPCWQMIYLSLFSIPLIFLLSQYGGNLVLPVKYQSAGLGYYKIQSYCIPLIGIIAALSGFFVGQGKLKLVLYSTVTINLINLALDFIFIFGIPNVIPAMGASGAAISALVSLLIQAIWLFLIFTNKFNRQNFGTDIISLDTRIFSKCVRVGLPISINHIFEMIGWFFIIKIISYSGVENFTIISIGSTLYLIYACINDGIFRSLGTIVSHHISAANRNKIRSTLISSCYFLILFLLFLLIPILFFPTLIIHLFNLKNYEIHWYNDIKISLLFIWLYFFLSGIYWTIAAVLTAKHRTKNIMISNVISIWVVSVLPIYILVNYYTLHASWIWPILCAYVLLSMLYLSAAEKKYIIN